MVRKSYCTGLVSSQRNLIPTQQDSSDRLVTDPLNTARPYLVIPKVTSESRMHFYNQGHTQVVGALPVRMGGYFAF